MIDIPITEDFSFDHLMNDVEAEIKDSKDFLLPDEMVVDAVKRACDFFHLPEVPVVNSEGSCVWPNNPETPFDDVFGFNRTELMELGIIGEDSLTLVYTHECAHRALQSYSELDSWEHELACDFFAGIHAGMEGMSTDNLEEALGGTHGSASHPVGSLRSDFIEYGKEIAEEMQARNIPVTFEGCLERFNAHLIEEENAIAQCRQNADGLIVPKNGEEHPLGFVDDKAWHEKQARDNFDNANWHRKEAEKATERGDYAAAKDHISRANSYESTGKDHIKSASSCTK